MVQLIDRVLLLAVQPSRCDKDGELERLGHPARLPDLLLWEKAWFQGIFAFSHIFALHFFAVRGR
ncbi:MAG: hypothetical protein ACI8XO_003923 [Verrucomicrobiales bacterium]|jgi:hypothetical protein